MKLHVLSLCITQPGCVDRIRLTKARYATGSDFVRTMIQRRFLPGTFMSTHTRPGGGTALGFMMRAMFEEGSVRGVLCSGCVLTGRALNTRHTLALSLA